MYGRKLLGPCPASWPLYGTCSPCVVPTKLPVVGAEASYTVGVAGNVYVTVYANGFGFPWTGPGTRSRHELWLGTYLSSTYKFATITQLVTGTADLIFNVVPDSNWLATASGGEIALWVRSYDDCNGSYVEDFAVSLIS